MASTPPPENATPSPAVKFDQERQDSQDGDQYNPKRGPHISRTNSSLLTRALAASKEAEEKGEAVGTGSSLRHHTENAPDVPPPPVLEDDWNNGLNTNAKKTENIPKSGTMAINAPAPKAKTNSTNLSSSLGSAPTTHPFNFDFNDTRHFNPLTNHRQLLSTTRARGTSLERTAKEKRVQAFVKGNFSTNPGDTALPPFAAESPAIFTSAVNNPPTEGPRARYRLWRGTHPNMAAEKAWSIGDEGNDEGGQVEKSVKAVIAGVEPNKRSRKASHGLGIFKEGLPEEKPKKRESKSKGPHRDGSSRKNVPTLGNSLPKSARPTDGASPIPSPHGETAATFKALSKKPTHDKTLRPTPEADKEDGYFEVENIPDAFEGDKTMPAALLAEIRKHQNLTPGATKGSSFSTSIPVMESEKSKSDDSAQNSDQFSKNDLDDETSYDSGGLSPIKSADDEEDSGEEQHTFLASALFIPHQASHRSSEQDGDGQKSATRSHLKDEGDIDTSSSQQWLEEWKVPSKDVDKNYLSQEPKPVPLPSPTHVKLQKSFLEKDGQFGEPQHAIAEDIHPPGDDFKSAKEVESVADDNETTPSVLPITVEQEVNHSAYDRLPQDAEPKAIQPLEAVELLPYRHQVGGHTIMWRFSKRAVCKKLNNAENKFYEKVEESHPELLEFLPRYIGVLNVSFETQVRRKSARKDKPNSLEHDAAQNGTAEPPKDLAIDTPGTGHGSAQGSSGRGRVISQSMQSSSTPTPTVMVADNRHIIPKSFLNPHLVDSQQRSKSDSAALLKTDSIIQQSGSPLPDSEFTFRPTLTDKHAASWGYTTVNKQLRNQVFQEAFLDYPIPVQRHKKPASQHRSLPNRQKQSVLRPSISESSLQVAQKSNPTLSAPVPEESIRRKAMKLAAERSTGPAPLNTAQQDGAEEAEGQASPTDDSGETSFSEIAGTSAPELEMPVPPKEKKRQRRYSSGGLRRKPAAVDDPRGEMKYYEEADDVVSDDDNTEQDDAGYKGDTEDDPFQMDPEPNQQSAKANPVPEVKVEALVPTEKPDVKATDSQEVDLGIVDVVDMSARPSNPNQARVEINARVEYFLLLEDLTMGMKKPCMMDLKMGTRQYGTEADAQKQMSQRKKCADTTSRKLGVRLCGLQVWNVKTQTWSYEDKYAGRKIQAGPEFQAALTRFLHDGVEDASVLRHIPTILKKLDKLEIRIRELAGWRLYAASLLIYYDGEARREDESDSTAIDKEPGKRNEVDVKMVDFANSVIGEESSPADRLCPPQHPHLVDYGFLRGLRTLRKYFRIIQEEIMAREMGRNMPQGIDYEVSDDEEGVVSE